MSAVKKIDVGPVASLELNGKTYDLPLVTGSEQEPAIDISNLRAQSGFVTLDNGYMNTGACTSAITFLDGEQGILRYRGYPIEQLAEQVTFTETAYLLIYGRLPVAIELVAFEQEIAKYSRTPEPLLAMIRNYPRQAHPMAALGALFMSLSAFYPELCEPDLKPEDQRRLICLQLAQVKNFIAYLYRAQNNLEFVEPNPKLGYSADFLNMMFHKPGYVVDAEIAKALDILLILHADHEQNCSTSTVRMVGSSKANLFASVAAGISALWGPLHGGANQAVIEMLEAIQKGGGDFRHFLTRAKDKNDSFKLMGFGHRVYKNFDPRAKIIKSACDTIVRKMNLKDNLLTIAKGLEEEALHDGYFVERKLYPNVDFYSGIIYKALGIPTGFFTPMFAMGRMPGWVAQWKELLEAPGFKINRPRQIYTGETVRPVKR